MTGPIEAGVIDSPALSVAEACEGAEVVFCAAPVAGLAELAAAALDACGPNAVVTDVGSTKRDIVAALGGDERFIGGHPLAGAETSGVENARADLFEGARWYLTPKSERSSGVLYDRLQRTVAGLGARVQAIDPEAHDRLMATISHLPHVVANVLVGQAAEELTRDSERMPEVGPSFRDTTRVAGANPAIWGDIFASNSEAVAEAVDAVAARLRDAAELIRERRARRGRRVARERRRGSPPAARGRAQRWPAARAARRRRQPARHDRRARPRPRRGRGQHRGHGALPDARHDLRRRLPLGLRRRSGRPRDGPGARAGPHGQRRRRRRVTMPTRFDPAGPLRGALRPPADKSISHRAALIAAMGEGETTIEGYLDSADTRSTLAAVQALGAEVEGVRRQ